MKNAFVIEADALRKTYRLGEDVVKALDGVSLQIAQGSMVAITGSSGSGKSTLMHILGCLDLPDQGRYRLSGEDVSALSMDHLAAIRNRRIGFIFQTFNLLPKLTAIENVELPLLYSGSPEARNRGEAALELVGLKDRMRHEPNQLSGGQRQRVAIARAIVTDPAILLADEPTGNLDTKTGDEILETFETLNAQGRTVVMVTHDDYVADHCRRKIALRDGQIVEDHSC